MKNLYEMYQTENDYEVDGVWQDIGPARIKLARSGGKNTLYQKTFTKVMKRWGKKSFDAVTEEEGKLILAEIFAKSVIKAWEVKDKKDEWVSGIEVMEKGKLKKVDFSIEVVTQCLIDLPDLFKDLQSWADDIKTFQKEVEEDQAKN